MKKIDKKIIIAIDGGPGVGKSSVSDIIARDLGIVHIDTGAMFRGLSYYFIKNNIELTEQNVIDNLPKINVVLKYDNNVTSVILNGEDITPYIRKEEVSKAASFVSKIKEVRKKLLDLQREMAKNQSVILDGQDIGTVVFPDADFKFFFTADVEKRAKKRTEDLIKKGEDVTYESVKKALEQRELENKTRKEAPIKKADDAIEFDTTKYEKEQTAKIILDMILERIDKA